MSRYNGQNVVQAGLIASVVPFILKTPDNPNGTDQSVSDNMTKQIDAAGGGKGHRPFQTNRIRRCVAQAAGIA